MGKGRKASTGSCESSGLPLDATALEAVRCFVSVLKRCGCSSADIQKAVREASDPESKRAAVTHGKAQRDITNASHVLTNWFSDALYLDTRGTPIWLPVRGPAPSLEALAARVDRTLDVGVLLRYLLRAKALKRRGRCYAPKRRTLSARGAKGAEVFANLRGLVGILKTLDHNLQNQGGVRTWFENWAENPAFPVGSRARFDRAVTRAGMEFLQGMDADMHRRELQRASGEPTVRMCIGLYRFEEEDNSVNPPVAGAQRRRGPRNAR